MYNRGLAPPTHLMSLYCASQSIDSLNTKRNLQRKLNPDITQISQPMTDGGVVNSPLLIGFHNQVTLGLSLRCN